MGSRYALARRPKLTDRIWNSSGWARRAQSSAATCARGHRIWNIVFAQSAKPGGGVSFLKLFWVGLAEEEPGNLIFTRAQFNE